MNEHTRQLVDAVRNTIERYRKHEESDYYVYVPTKMIEHLKYALETFDFEESRPKQ